MRMWSNGNSFSASENKNEAPIFRWLASDTRYQK